MKFNAYVDGFNLYKGLLAGKDNLKWLDIRALCQSRWPDYELNEVFYFTAPLKERFKGDDAPRRQHTYLRALEGSGVTLVKGKFTKDTDWLRLSSSRHSDVIWPALTDEAGQVQGSFDRSAALASPDSITGNVWKFGEKGSDVNLASYLLLHAFTSNVKASLIISGDSDLCTPIEFAVKAGIQVKVCVPNKKQGSVEVRKVASFVEDMHPDWVHGSLFPRQVLSKAGSQILRPSKWD